jgi:hypothetical protein
MRATGILRLALGSVLGVYFLFGLGLVPASQAQELRYALGVHGSMLRPAGPFKGWYNISPAFVGQLTYQVSDRTMTEVEVTYSPLADAGLSDRSFTWHNGLGAANGSSVKSPGAEASMWIGGIVVNGLRTFQPDEPGRSVPYIAAGIGFLKYTHEVSGLIWPGQVGEQIRTDSQGMKESTVDEDVALSINTGLGFYRRTSDKFLVDFRIRWNVSMGELRPYEDWDLKKTFPIFSFNLMVGIKYYVR